MAEKHLWPIYTAQRYKCGFPLEENASFVPVFSIIMHRQ